MGEKIEIEVCYTDKPETEHDCLIETYLQKRESWDRREGTRKTEGHKLRKTKGIQEEKAKGCLVACVNTQPQTKSTRSVHTLGNNAYRSEPFLGPLQMERYLVSG